ncbi:MAG: DUF1194 domain-containing protein [Pseudomonadota bacterium]
MLYCFAKAPLLALAFVVGTSATAPAWEMDGQEVDVELVLAVDVSLSVTPREMEVQRRGYAEAITSNEVMTAVRAGLLGSIAVTYVEWAGGASQRTVIDWTLIETPDDAQAFADVLLNSPPSSLRRTSISNALIYAADTFDGNGFEGLRKVIDISGDGPNNSGGPVVQARNEVTSRGIVINGLPLMTREGYGGRWDLEDLDVYYEDCVIGGPGAFVIPVTEWSEFATAVRRKLVMEIAGLVPRAEARIILASEPAPYDCLIGERIWDTTRPISGTP